MEKRKEKIVLVYPLAKTRYFKEAICATFILLIIWGCIVIYPTITIMLSGEKITASDLEFIYLIGFIVFVCSLFCLWWLYLVFKGHRLSANSEAYCISVSTDELAVGIALLDDRASFKFIRNNILSLKISWSQLKNFELLDTTNGNESGSAQIVLTVEDLRSHSGIKRYSINMWYFGKREKELLNEIQAHLSYPIKGITND